MKKLFLLLLAHVWLLNGMEEKQVFTSEEEQEKVTTNKAAELWHLLDREGLPDLKFMSALGLIKQSDAAIEGTPIPEDLKEYAFSLKTRLGEKLVKLLEQRFLSSIDLEHVQLLINSGAYLDRKDSNGITALIHAIFNHPEIAKLLLINTDPAHLDIQDNQDSTALMTAVMMGNNEIAEQLINAGADPNIQDNHKDTALLLAAGENNKNIVELLIKAKARLNTKNKNGDTALMLAHDNDIVNLLINAGANLDAKDSYGDTALIKATKRADNEMAKLLIEAYANPNLQDSNGMTALMIATQNGAQDLVEPLMRGGASVSIENYENKTAYDIANEQGFDEIAQILEKYL
jgi:uncharacterized protein